MLYMSIYVDCVDKLLILKKYFIFSKKIVVIILKCLMLSLHLFAQGKKNCKSKLTKYSNIMKIYYNLK